MSTVEKIPLLKQGHNKKFYDNLAFKNLQGAKEHGIMTVLELPVSLVFLFLSMLALSNLQMDALGNMLVCLLLGFSVVGTIRGMMHSIEYAGTWIAYRSFKKLKPHERETHRYWHSWLRACRHETILELNAIIEEFNLHLDSLRIDRREPGPQEQRAHAAIMAYRDQVAGEMEFVDLLLLKTQRRADVGNTTSALNQLKTTTRGREHSGGGKMAADLEVEQAGWRSRSGIDASKARTTDRLRQSRAALAKAKRSKR